MEQIAAGKTGQPAPATTRRYGIFMPPAKSCPASYDQAFVVMLGFWLLLPARFLTFN